jgi:GH24 family phage-related lysozyme (muramidase)
MKERLRQLLEHDEGCVYEVYLDHLDKPTCGIGHLIVPFDKEFGWPVGAPVSEERVNELFEKDVMIAISDARWLIDDFDDLPEDAQITVASLCFQLGRSRYSKFVKHLAAIRARNWEASANQLRDSKLYKQATNRTERHAKRLESLDNG